MKVLLVGHAFGPNRGSEPGFTWNWAWHLSANHQVCVLAHPKYRDEVEKYLAEHPNANLEYIWVTLPAWCEPWQPTRGERGIKLHYVLWQKAALKQAMKLHQRQNFDLVHHISWGTLNAPPSLWRLGIPFVWGPIGGGQTTPPSFSPLFRSSLATRGFQEHSCPKFKTTTHITQNGEKSSLILATNRETAQILRAAGASRVKLFLDGGLSAAQLSDHLPQRGQRSGLTLLWAGRLETRKALPLALEALEQVNDPSVRLIVAGGGPLQTHWEMLAHQLGLKERVKFVGTVPWNEMPDLFMKADAFFFSSLRDSFGSVVLEAMARALPILTLDHHGVGAFVPAHAGIKVPVTSPDETVSALADGIRQLAQSASERQRMGEAAWEYARTQTWERRAEQMSRWYEECLKDCFDEGQADNRNLLMNSDSRTV